MRDAATGVEQLVINLCSSTTPMSLVRPAFKELERFTFFVSRRREDGRERFRLHMGYFATRVEAEKLLAIVRSVYPGAWISEAPGKKLRANSPDASRAPAAAAAGAASADSSVQTGLHRSLLALDGVQDPADGSASFIGQAPVVTTVQAPTVPQPPVLGPARAVSHPVVSAAAPPVATAPVAGDVSVSLRDLSDSQVMRMLERGPATSVPVTEQISDVPMLHKLDAHSLQALRKDLSKNLPVPFAVQLEWSPTPIDVRKIPPLAIFRAYTLYTVGCQFDGRKWYGLRLGFFSDALSAKQVAQYVRSEFKSVAVVPVSNRERSQADATGGIDVDKASPVRHETGASGEEITLLPEQAKAATSATGTRPAIRIGPKAPQANSNAANRPGRAAAAPPSRVLPRGAGRSGANRTLEETLEILGASQLSIDNGKGERVNFPGRRGSANAKTTTFSKLLDRLADRLKS